VRHHRLPQGGVHPQVLVAAQGPNNRPPSAIRWRRSSAVTPAMQTRRTLPQRFPYPSQEFFANSDEAHSAAEITFHELFS